MTLPVKYSDLSSAANLCLTIFDCAYAGGRQAIGGTTISLFGQKSNVFRQGQLDLRVWNNVKADGKRETTTPGKTKSAGKENMQRLAKLSKRHKDGKMTSVDWLDRLTFAEVERVSQKEKQTSNLLFLMIEFPKFMLKDVSHSVVYFEKNGMLKNELTAKSDIIRCPDFDIDNDNLVEAKHHRLARSQRTGQSDRDLKPNADLRNRLNDIISYPSTQALTSEEQDLIWRFRYYLSTNKKALSKFVKCINWRVKSESAQALDLIAKWSPMDPEDALELLGPSFKHITLRQYAVERLKQAPDEDLQLYLLQLVQALKYERINESWLKRDLEDSQREVSIDESLPPSTMTIEEVRVKDILMIKLLDYWFYFRA